MKKCTEVEVNTVKCFLRYNLFEFRNKKKNKNFNFINNKIIIIVMQFVETHSMISILNTISNICGNQKYQQK